MARSIVVLLPPSEGKAGDGRGAIWSPGRMALPDLDAARSEVLAALDATGAGVGERPTRKAIDRYTGVLYKELDAASLDSAARRRFNRSTLIVSGLWGLVAPGDPIPDYRLKMSANLAPLGKLSTWWRPLLTDVLKERLDRRVVWDLLPQEHAAAWRPEEVAMARRITVRFVSRDGKTVSHWNKLLKGSLVRHLAVTGLDDVAGLSSFTHPAGYRYDPSSTARHGSHISVVLREG